MGSVGDDELLVVAKVFRMHSVANWSASSADPLRMWNAMRSALRSRAFMAEDPEAQPTPEAAARALADLLRPNAGVESGIYRVSEGRAVRD